LEAIESGSLGWKQTVSELRLGALGGTFDPILNGHIQVAREVARRFRLDRVLLIPAATPPHKNARSIADAYHRHAMTVLATVDEPDLVVSTIELEAPERPYTFETIERLRNHYGESAALFLVMGADSFREIDTWREPVKVLESANWVVVTRPGHEIVTTHLPDHLRSRIIDLRGGFEPPIERPAAVSGPAFTYLLDCVSEDISSTRIREMVARRMIGSLVPRLAAGYIEKYELYRR
jgi:nicotinate-nucleotide adenylyltransferase